MPFYHKPRIFVPLSIKSEKKAVKNGLHHAIFTSRFDRYVGDWKQDLKEGKIKDVGSRAVARVEFDGSIAYRYFHIELSLKSLCFKFAGKGMFLTINGRFYEGDWYKGYRHGFGTLSYQIANGTFHLEYRGEWVQGKPEGIGWRYYANGDIYFGFWNRGKHHGYGKLWYFNGTYYVGYWNMNNRKGLGMFVKENGTRYEGNWENNLKNGLGRFYHLHTGQLQEGCWMNDICVKSKISDIIIRQFCEEPTPYPIPPESLQDSRKILEDSELWLNQKLCDIDRNLKYCIDQMI